MTIHDIPTYNAALNAAATVLIGIGFVMIKLKRIAAHRAAMLTAAVVSALFLVGYISHKVLKGMAAGTGEALHTKFGGSGAIAIVYYVMLITHVILAMAIAYLVPRTFAFALKGDFATHRRWARVTFPIWFYVSVTGVLVYFFLYVWWPAKPA